MASRCLPSSIYLGGSAWGCAFYVGCYEALEERFGHKALADVKFLGDSAGALLALGMALGRPASELDALYRKLAENATERGVVGSMSVYHQEAIDGLMTSGGTSTAQSSLEKLNRTGSLEVRIFLFAAPAPQLTAISACCVVLQGWHDRLL